MARLKRPVSAVKRGSGIAEELEHRKIGLAMPIVAGGVDKRADPAVGNEHVTRPEVAVKKCRRRVRRQAIRKCGCEAFDAPRQARRKMDEMDEQPALGPELRPGPGP